MIALTGGQRKIAANKLADRYIYATDHFLKNHADTTWPRASRSFFLYNVLGLASEAEICVCETWAMAIQTAMDGVINANAGDLKNWVEVRWAQHKQGFGPTYFEHHYIALYPKNTIPDGDDTVGVVGSGYIAPGDITADIKSKLMLLDPWPDILPRAYTPAEHETMGWPLTNLGHLKP